MAEGGGPLPMEDPPRPWLFPASGEIIEVLEWRTDVLQAEAGEQRIALRATPRVTLTLEHRADASAMAEVVELARAGFTGRWLVPAWLQALRPEVDLAQDADEIEVDTELADFGAPGPVATPSFVGIAVDGGQAQLVEVDSVTVDRLVLAEPLGAILPEAQVAAGRVAVMPVRRARMVAPLEITRRRQDDGVIRASFLLDDTAAPGAPDLPLYLGLRVQTSPSLLRRPLSMSLARAIEQVDNGLGPVTIEPLRALVERKEAITLKACGPEARARLSRWLWSLEGRRASFWLPTWGRELGMQAAMTSGSALMRIAPISEPEVLVGRAILLEMPDGLRLRSITKAIIDGPDHRLTLSSSLGQAVPKDTRVHFLTRVRADADRIEIRHGVLEAEVTLPVVEVEG